MDEEIETIEESFERIPEEIKHYIYSDSFSDSFKKICVEQNLSTDEVDRLRISLYSYLAQIENEEQLITTVNSVNKNPDSNQKIMNWIQENVVDKVLEISTNTFIDSEDGLEENEISTEISPAQALASIKERLGSTSSVAPITRDYSFTKTETPKESVTEAPKVDPYRELPER